MSVTLKLRDPEFVADYLKQEIETFCKNYPKINENDLREFCVPIQKGIENVLFENRRLNEQLNEALREIASTQNTLDSVVDEVSFYINSQEETDI